MLDSGYYKLRTVVPDIGNRALERNLNAYSQQNCPGPGWT